MKILHKDIYSISDDDTSLTSDIKCKVLDYLDDKYSDTLCRWLLSLACFSDPRFNIDYIPEDVGMSTITNWIVEEGVKLVPSEDSYAGCQIIESSQVMKVSHKKNLYTKEESWLVTYEHQKAVRARRWFNSRILL